MSLRSDPLKPAAWLEILVLACLFGLMADGPPPGTNEAHYLAKAKHYWDPSFGAGDVFLESADAHLVFYWTFGWLTQLFSLTTTAWIGRVASWLLLAWGWQRLSATLIPQRGVAVLSGVAFVLVQRHLQMAGEWIVGGVEAKCFAYAAVFHALAFLVRGKWVWCWPCLGLATSFHVLVGGWSMVAAAVAFLLDRDARDLRQNALSLLAALVLAAPGLIPAVILARGASGVSAEAAEIYVYRRLPHHLAFHRFNPVFQLRFGLACAAWVVLWNQMSRRRDAEGGRWNRLHGFVAGALAIAAAGVMIDLLLQSQPQAAAQLLRFYWYRLADAILPAGLVLSAAAGLLHLKAPMTRRLLTGLASALVMAAMGRAAMNNWRVPVPEAFIQPRRNEVADVDERLRQFRDWRAANHWLRENTPADTRLLACRGQQTLKWYAERGDVGNWKDIPQDAEAVVKWYQRQEQIFPREVRRDGLTFWPDAELVAMMKAFGANYLLLDRVKSQRTPSPEYFERVFPAEGSATFEIYRPLDQIPVEEPSLYTPPDEADAGNEPAADGDPGE